MDEVVKGKLPFDEVFSPSDEAFLLICMDNYRERWLEEFSRAAQMETRNVWGQKRSADVLVSYLTGGTASRFETNLHFLTRNRMTPLKKVALMTLCL